MSHQPWWKSIQKFNIIRKPNQPTNNWTRGKTSPLQRRWGRGQELSHYIVLNPCFSQHSECSAGGNFIMISAGQTEVYELLYQLDRSLLCTSVRLAIQRYYYYKSKSVTSYTAVAADIPVRDRGSVCSVTSLPPCTWHFTAEQLRPWLFSNMNNYMLERD